MKKRAYSRRVRGGGEIGIVPRPQSIVRSMVTKFGGPVKNTQMTTFNQASILARERRLAELAELAKLAEEAEEAKEAELAEQAERKKQENAKREQEKIRMAREKSAIEAAIEGRKRENTQILVKTVRGTYQTKRNNLQKELNILTREKEEENRARKPSFFGRVLGRSQPVSNAYKTRNNRIKEIMSNLSRSRYAGMNKINRKQYMKRKENRAGTITSNSDMSLISPEHYTTSERALSNIESSRLSIDNPNPSVTSSSGSNVEEENEGYYK